MCLPGGSQGSDVSTFLHQAPLLPPAWALLARLDAPLQRHLAAGGAIAAPAAAAAAGGDGGVAAATRAPPVLLAAQRFVAAAPFLAAALLRWVVARDAQLASLERDVPPSL